MNIYPEYKSSGIDWLDQIPSYWETKPFKWIFSTSTGITFTKADIVEKGNAVMSYGQIHSPENTGTSVNESLLRYIPESITNGKDNAILSNGDFLFADTSEDLEGCGNCVYNDKDYPIYAGYHSIICKPLIDINGNYVAYLFKTDEWRSQIRSRVYGVKVFSITQTILAQTSIILPPLSEQETIAAYLDEVTGKVDALIAEKQKQVEDLRAYRSSLITETVTRGLNPDAPLRYSGIDWLGDIPEHWEITKLKYISTVQTGSTPSTSIETYWDNPVKNWFTPGDFNTFRLSSSNRKVSEIAFKEGACRIFPKNSTLLVGIGATLGKVGIATVECSANQQVNAITFNDKVYPLYGTYYLSTCNDALNSISNASTLAILNQEQTKQFPIIIPPISEQKAIAKFLDDKTTKIDALIDELNKQLEELAEYKKAVISEAVTGKVDVRDWKPKN